MSDIVPRLDTIEFDQLVEQARGDIPRYAPDWTDHNLHDPGITLIDLLAWIVDQQVYRTGFVGGRYHQAFAALLGERPEGPASARGLVWPNHPVKEARSIDAGSAVICLRHPELSFALEWPDAAAGDVDDVGKQRSIYFPEAKRMTVGLAVDGVELPAGLSQTDGGSWAIADSGRTSGTVLTLGFDGPLGSPKKTANVSLGVEVAPPPGPPPSSGDWRPWGPVIYSYRVGEGQWVDVEVVYDGTFGLATSGVVILAMPKEDETEKGASELRLDLDRGFFPVPPQLRDVSINVIPVVQRERVKDAPLTSGGTGQPDQAVDLDTTDLVNPPSRPRGPVLQIKVGGEFWEKQPDFSRSGPYDRHFVVRPDHVLFGNGLNGHRPERGAPISHTELARTRGAAGNVHPGLSWSVPALGASGTDYGQNRQPLTGGKDPTGLEELVIAAQDAATTRSATVTDDDLVAAAYELAGMAVGRAAVVSRFDHRLPGSQVDGVRTLVVLPHQPSGRGGNQPAAPMQASQAYLDEVAARLDARRVLGERLIVQGPVIVAVDLSLTIATEPGTVADEVKSAVKRAIEARLALVRSDGVDPWPLGRDLTTSEVETIAANVPGVATVHMVRVAVAGDKTDASPVTVPPDGLIVANEVQIFIEAVGSRHLHRLPSPESGRGPTQ